MMRNYILNRGIANRAYYTRKGISNTRYIYDMVFTNEDFSMIDGVKCSKTKNPNISYIMTYEIFSTKPFARHRTKSVYYKASYMRKLSDIGKTNKKKGLRGIQEEYDRAYR